MTPLQNPDVSFLSFLLLGCPKLHQTTTSIIFSVGFGKDWYFSWLDLFTGYCLLSPREY